MLAGLEAVRAEHDEKTVCLVSHAVVARVLVLEALGLALDRLWTLDLSATGITELEFRADWAAVHRMNTLVHLDALAREPRRRRGTAAAADAAPEGRASIYLPDEAAQKRAGRGAAPRRVPALGVPRGGHAHATSTSTCSRGAPTSTCRSSMFKLVDRESGRLLALRADITPQIARIVATRLRDEPQAAAPGLRDERVPLRRAAGGRATASSTRPGSS